MASKNKILLMAPLWCLVLSHPLAQRRLEAQSRRLHLPGRGWQHRHSPVRKEPEKYAPSMKGNKNAIALTQLTSSVQGSEDALCIVQRLVKLIGKVLQRCADIVGMVMAQVPMKAALKKWGKAAEHAINIEIKQHHW
jgi:hypothetical protein